jgi:transglutaminase-like putative cysteine protease
MRFKIQHITKYQYSDRVSHCYNLAYMTPRKTDRQTCEKSKISITPAVASTSKNIDYFGNTAYHFEILRAHKELTINCESIVTTADQECRFRLEKSRTCLETLNQLATNGEEELIVAKEFILDSSMIQISNDLRDYALPSFAEDKPFLQCVMDLTSRIFSEFSYSPESTTIATPLSEVLANKKGVCQDFAHLQIACLRSLGFPAKYVSGYLETLPLPGEVKLVGADATHAWISVYSVDEGWVEFDPTNNCIAGEQHIVTAFGRDYFDVTPLKGVIYGGGKKPLLTVSVDVART